VESPSRRGNRASNAVRGLADAGGARQAARALGRGRVGAAGLRARRRHACTAARRTAREADRLGDPARGAAVRDRAAFARRQALLERVVPVLVALTAAVSALNAGAVDVGVDPDCGVAGADFERQRANARAAVGARIEAAVGGRRRFVATAARADEIAAALARGAGTATARRLTTGAAQRRRRAAHVRAVGGAAVRLRIERAIVAAADQHQKTDDRAREAAANGSGVRHRACAQQAACHQRSRRSRMIVAPAPPSRARADANARTPTCADAALASQSQIAGRNTGPPASEP